MAVPGLLAEFKRWHGNQCAPGVPLAQITKSTYRAYVRYVERFLQFEESRLGGVGHLDEEILNFGKERLLRLPFPTLFRDSLPAVTSKRDFNNAYQKLVACVEDFFESNYLNLVTVERESEVERHLKICRRKVTSVRKEIRSEVNRGLAVNKETRRREGHLSENPEQVLDIMRLYKNSPTATDMRNRILTNPLEEIRKGEIKVMT